MVYGDNIATFIKGRGTSVINLEKTPKIDKEKEEKKRQAKQVAGKILEEQIAKAIEYLKDEENRKKVVEAGVAVAQFVISIAAKKKK